MFGGGVVVVVVVKASNVYSQSTHTLVTAMNYGVK